MKTTPLPENRLPTAVLLDTHDARTADATAPPDERAAPAMRSAAPAHAIATAHGAGRWSSPSIAIAIIVALGTLLFIVNLGAAPLYTKGEPREAVTIFDIVHGGGVILPLRAGVEIPSKPLLMHWLAAIVSLIAGGVTTWTVRLPSALLAIGGMLATYLYVRRLFEARAALIAAVMIGTTFQYLQAGTGSRVDMTLTFFMTIAFFEFIAIAEGLSARTTVLYLAMALAMLTKGPIGAALPVLTAMVWIALTRRWNLWRRLDLKRGALIVGLIGGGWYIAAIVSGGAAFVHKQILGENLYRLIGHRGVNVGHAHPFYYEEAALLAGFMPWTPIAIVALWQAIRRPRRLDARLGYLLVWFSVVLIFYNLPLSKRGVYLMSLYPALATIIALYLSDAITDGAAIARPVRWLTRGMGGFFVATAAAAIAGLAILYAAPALMLALLARGGIMIDALPGALRATAHQWAPLTIAMPIAVAAIGGWMIRGRPATHRLIVAIAAGFAAIVLAVNLIVEPAVANTLTLQGFAATAIKTANGAPIGYFGSLDYGFAFYSGRNIAFVTSKESIFAYVVCSEDDYRLMWPAMRARYTIVRRSNPTDFDGSGRMLLLERIGGGESPPSAIAAPAPAAPLPETPSRETPSPSATPSGRTFDL
ncbi:MAG: glycosyltransferase family 39 protein [Candidatus Binataceae bacterium]|nr:glycosyltransferase family 39 protein [Candidatus Binataceae bacterium]